MLVLRVTSSLALPSAVGRVNLIWCAQITCEAPGTFVKANLIATSLLPSLSTVPAATWLRAVASIRSNWPPSRSVTNSATSVAAAELVSLM